MFFAFAILFGAALNAFAQNENTSPKHHFVITDDALIWQKIYKTTLNYDQLANAVENTGLFNNIRFADNKIMAEINRTSINYESLGYNRGSVPIYISATDASAFVLIECKEGRYRATIKNVKLTTNINSGALTDGEVETLDTYALKNGDFRKSFLKKPVEIYEYNFNNLLDFTTPQSDNNW